MRIIDADKFEEALENSCSTERESIAFVNFLAYMDEQPTAYDVKKVVEQLEKCKKAYPFGTWTDMIEEAIRIVKGGGRNE